MKIEIIVDEDTLEARSNATWDKLGLFARPVAIEVLTAFIGTLIREHQSELSGLTPPAKVEEPIGEPVPVPGFESAPPIQIVDPVVGQGGGLGTVIRIPLAARTKSGKLKKVKRK